MILLTLLIFLEIPAGALPFDDFSFDQFLDVKILPNFEPYQDHFNRIVRVLCKTKLLKKVGPTFGMGSEVFSALGTLVTYVYLLFSKKS